MGAERGEFVLSWLRDVDGADECRGYLVIGKDRIEGGYDLEWVVLVQAFRVALV